MRCPDCNKFVAYDEPEIDINSEEVDEEGNITIEVQVGLPCAECGTGLKETWLSFETKSSCPVCDSVKFEIESTADGRVRQQNSRKTFYGADITVNCTCSNCGHDWDLSGEVEALPSEFDEVC